MRRRIALVDMDSTLVDYHGAMCRDLELLRGPTEPVLTEAHADEFPHIKRRCTMIKNQKDWWYNLDPIISGFKVVRWLTELGFEINVCTRGPRPTTQAWEQKYRWCKDHLPEAGVVLTLDKSIVFGNVLVDDWLPYVEGWQNRWRSGFCVVPAHPWNETYNDAMGVRFVDGVNDEEVKERLAHHAQICG